MRSVKSVQLCHALPDTADAREAVRWYMRKWLEGVDCGLRLIWRRSDSGMDPHMGQGGWDPDDIAGTLPDKYDDRYSWLRRAIRDELASPSAFADLLASECLALWRRDGPEAEPVINRARFSATTVMIVENGDMVLRAPGARFELQDVFPPGLQLAEKPKGFIMARGSGFVLEMFVKHHSDLTPAHVKAINDVPWIETDHLWFISLPLATQNILACRLENLNRLTESLDRDASDRGTRSDAKLKLDAERKKIGHILSEHKASARVAMFFGVDPVYFQPIPEILENSSPPR